MKALFTVIVFGLLCLATSTLRAEGLRILTTELPPVISIEDGKLKGFCIDVIEEIQRRLGDHTVIEVMPWARAYESGLHEPNVILVCPKRNPEREHLFKWVGPIFTSETNFYAKRGAAPHIESLDDLKRMSGVLVPRAAYIVTLLQSNGFQNIEVTKNPVNMVRMLMVGRWPVIALDAAQLEGALSEANIRTDAIEKVFSLGTATAYFTFSKQIPDEVVSKWQVALDRIKKEGLLRKMYKKWLLSN